MMKLIMLQVTNICDAWEITGNDSMLHVLPLHHTHGLIHALISPMAVGARLVISGYKFLMKSSIYNLWSLEFFRCVMLQKFEAVRVWKELLSTSDKRPNVLMGVPTVWVKLVEQFEKDFANDPKKVQFIKETLSAKMRLDRSRSNLKSF
jgi:malonyl-CoA/methylmalonyl-CoA synthetase